MREGEKGEVRERENGRENERRWETEREGGRGRERVAASLIRSNITTRLQRREINWHSWKLVSVFVRPEFTSRH